MKLYVWQSVCNFGDQLNYWLWPQVFPNLFDNDGRELFLGIGSVIWDHYDQSTIKHVFGSGYAYDTVPIIDSFWRFYFVRGPLTATRFGLDASQTITDPAILVASYWDGSMSKKHRTTFMPHYFHDKTVTRQVCAEMGIHYISPSDDVKTIIADIAASEHVISEALHGAVVADAFGVPWTPVDLLGINHLKWHDWCLSLCLKYQPVWLLRPPYRGIIRRIGPLMRHVLSLSLKVAQHEKHRFLSEENLRARLVERIQDKAVAFRKAVYVE